MNSFYCGSNDGDCHDNKKSTVDKSSGSIGTIENSEGGSIQVISNSQKTKQMYLSLIRNSRKEVRLIFPTTNAIRREEQIGILSELCLASRRGVDIRILTPEDEFVKAHLDLLRNEGVIIRKIESPAEAKFKLLVVDRTYSLVVETRDDTRSNFEQAVGLATLSNSKTTVMPYVTIFESFWREADLYEKAKEADRIKEEFVNIAAHELRNPIHPIIVSGEFVMEDIKKLKAGDRIDKDTIDNIYDSISIMVRNAARLHKLSEDILQVTRIESGKFALNLEEVDIKSFLKQIIKDARKRIELLDKKDTVWIDIEDRLMPTNDKGEFILHFDSLKINQVLYNLIDNAIKFTDKGQILLHAAIYKGNDIIIRIEDSGMGIDPTIQDKLFQKFSSKSDGGTGLGLYIAKKIVESHGGRIWATNNSNIGGVGGTAFSFTLPIDTTTPPLNTASFDTLQTFNLIKETNSLSSASAPASTGSDGGSASNVEDRHNYER